MPENRNPLASVNQSIIVQSMNSVAAKPWGTKNRCVLQFSGFWELFLGFVFPSPFFAPLVLFWRILSSDRRRRGDTDRLSGGLFRFRFF
ncbi:hypothetical protein BDV23DRAFT_41380 [Aspergillus alliaceus]|uniref:Uncharacterized protein n=1 Tax=Petromyces alliaceus TaxID=209559 RepID=A0A5N7CHB0_PETAA|nr:hypothetical protein BDV23DRAFT_41380 [Aspergillus alliaceus]